ncbi:MAG: hypothetical protein RLY86_1475 [Pseudomonadota bacterium]|jgi:hypothetical protein
MAGEPMGPSRSAVQRGRFGRDGKVVAASLGISLVVAAFLLHDQDRRRSPMTELLQVTCDVPGSQMEMVLPLDFLARSAVGVPVRIGPLVGPVSEEGVSIEFRTDAGLADPERRRDLIVVPLLTDSRGQSPRRLILLCREGRIGVIRFEWPDGSRRDMPIAERTKDGHSFERSRPDGQGPLFSRRPSPAITEPATDRLG